MRALTVLGIGAAALAKFPRAKFWFLRFRRQPPTKMAAVNNQEMDYAIKPEAVKPTISTEDWPLLLKNYEKRMWKKLLQIFVHG